MTLAEKLSQGIGRRALVMIEVFPFFIVGTLDDVQGDHINIIAEFGVPLQFQGKDFNLNIANIAALYVEENEGEIPRMQ